MKTGQPSTLITGSTGFIGQRLVNALTSREESLRLLKRRVEDGDHSSVTCDLMKLEIDDAWLHGIKTVYHLAGYAHDLSNPSEVAELYQRLNVEASIKLAEAAARAQVQSFVYVSSVKAAGSETNGQPDGIYGQTKREAEKKLLELGQKEGLRVVILRPSLVYGPDLKGNLELMMRGIRDGWFPPLPETQNKRSMVHVDDVVNAMMYIADHPTSAGEIYTLTDGIDYSTRDIYDALRAVVGKNPTRLSVPYLAFELLGRLYPRFRHKLDKLFGTEFYSSDKIRALGFKTGRSLRDINETNY